MKKRNLEERRWANTKLMARPNATYVKQRWGLANGARTTPRGTWSQRSGFTAARGASWHYTDRKPWRTRRKLPRSGNRHAKRLRSMLKLVMTQRGELLCLREQATRHQQDKHLYEAMIERLQAKCQDLPNHVDELNDILGLLDATTQAHMVEVSVLGQA